MKQGSIEPQGQRAGARGHREHPACSRYPTRASTLVTITGCEVSYDRSVCNVFYTTEPERYEDVAAAFQKASGRIRSLMARKLSWRVAPELRFLLDKSVDEAERIAIALAADADRNAVAAPTTATCRPTPIRRRARQEQAEEHSDRTGRRA